MTRDRNFKRPVRARMACTGESYAAARALSPKQAALLAFWIVYRSDPDGLTTLCDQLPHRMVDGQFWTFVEAGLERIQTPELLTVLRQLRAEVSACLVERGRGVVLKLRSA